MVSCYNEEVPELPSAKPESIAFTDAELAVLYQMRGQSHKVDIGEATEFANTVIGFLDANTSTRVSSPRKVSSMVALTGERAMTRTADGENVQMPDTLAYLFNFSDSAGYAIISADKRIEASILSYCEAGNLAGKTDNPGLIGALMDLEHYITASIIRYENRIDSITNEILSKMIAGDSVPTRLAASQQDLLQDYEVTVALEPITPIYSGVMTEQATYSGDWVTIEQVEPLLPVEWHQWFPFNFFVKHRDRSTNAPAGCVAVATAQIMAYWQRPARIDDGFIFDWPLLRKFATGSGKYPNVEGKEKFWYNKYSNNDGILENTDVHEDERNFIIHSATLMEKIGEGVIMEYSDNGSSARSQNAASFFKSCGYNVGDGLVDYNFGKVVQSLRQHRPVYARGSSKMTRKEFLGIEWEKYSEGHAWVIDGYTKQSKATIMHIRVSSRYTGEVLNESTNTTYSYADYFHHNWGWGDDRNGYFVAGNFDSDDKIKNFSTRTSENFDPGNYQYDKEIIYGIVPR